MAVGGREGNHTLNAKIVGLNKMENLSLNIEKSKKLQD